MDSSQIIKIVDSYLQSVLKQGLQNEGFRFPLDPESIEDGDLKSFCFRLSLIFDMIDESCRFSEELARGNLQVSASRKNFFTMPLKGLQASLAHLTWQVNQVAEGDLNQQVSFLGEFSDSFNNMIESLREKQVLEERIKVITDVLGEGLLFVDNDGIVLFANPGALTLLEYQFEEIDCLNAVKFFHISTSGENLLQGSISKGLEYNENDGVLIQKSGKEVPVMISARPVFKNEILDGTVITFRDISEQKKYLLLLEKQAMTDVLTGIFNRMKFDEILSSEIQRSKRNKVPLSMILCDIDHFKQVNDKYGHPAGDKILKRLTKLVSANIRNVDFFARWGGEEFVILSPGTDSEGAAQLAEKIRQKVEHHNFKNPEHITLSFGITSFKTGDIAMKLINRADEAMYRAKENGRNQVQVYSSAPQTTRPFRSI